MTGFLGRPELGCTPECITSLDCSYEHACVNQRCIDPCVGSCGLGAQCQVSNHNPICSCPKGMVGDPFRICQPAPPGMLHVSSSPYCSLIENKLHATWSRFIMNNYCYFQLHPQSLSHLANKVHVAAMLSAHHQAIMPCARVWKVIEATHTYNVDLNVL